MKAHFALGAKVRRPPPFPEKKSPPHTPISPFEKQFANYTTPLECLLSPEEVSQTEEGQQTLFELQQHMSDAKGVFLDQRVARNILERMDETLGKVKKLKDVIFAGKFCECVICLWAAARFTTRAF